MKYDIGYYTEQCYSAFKQLQVKSNYSINGIRANICEWLKKKEPLFNLLRKHPLWNEEAKAVIFECTEVREIDANIFYKAMRKLEYLIVNILPFSYINSRDFYEITHSEDETIYL